MRILIFRILGATLMVAGGLTLLDMLMRPPRAVLISRVVTYSVPGSMLLIGLWAFLREGPYKVRTPHRAQSPQPDTAVPVVTKPPPPYYVVIDGVQSGPFTIEELRDLWRAGVVSDSTPFWFEGAPDWQPLSEIAAAFGERAGEYPPRRRA